MSYSPWGRKEVDMTERLHFHFTYLTALSYKRATIAQILHLHSNNGVEERSGGIRPLSLPLYQESKIIPRHTQKKMTSLSLVRVVSLALFSKNLHSILTTFSFSFLIFKEGSGCHFCVSVVHNRKNMYRKRSDTEGTLRT